MAQRIKQVKADLAALDIPAEQGVLRHNYQHRGNYTVKAFLNTAPPPKKAKRKATKRKER